MDRQEIELKVKEALAKRLDAKIEEIKLESSLTDDLGMDSLGSFEVMFGLAEAFKMEVSDEDFVEFRTVEDVINYILGRLEKNKTESKEKNRFQL